MPKQTVDTLLLFILVIAQVEINTLADNVLPDRLADTRRLVEGWWPAWSLDRLDHPQTDPLTMMLIVLAFGVVLIYILTDLLASVNLIRVAKTSHRLKMGLIYGIIGLLVIGKTVLLINLRHHSVPWSYSHDGGVIQTEVTIDYFLHGLNPYVEDYLDTAMAEWGINEYRTALYHYPYLPWTFVFSTPFYLLAQSWLGWYDQRLVYLLLFGLMLVLTQKLFKNDQNQRLVVMLIGLNPIMSVDIIFGVNDPFVLSWIIVGIWFLYRAEHQAEAGKNRLWGSVALGLACASKPTAWFLVPFWGLYILKDVWPKQFIPPLKDWLPYFKPCLKQILGHAWTLPLTALLLLLPWFVWNPAAMYDDVWRWAAGLGETGYQIWGWGGSNLVLAFGLIEDRFVYWPFIIPQAIIGLPLLLFLLWQQQKYNTLGRMLYGYAIFLFVFFYLSRFMQPNYLGFLGSLLILAYYLGQEEIQTQSDSI